MKPIVLLYLLALLIHSAFSSPTTIEPTKVKNNTEGCPECAAYRCPSDENECLLGLVKDSCGCCDHGICARLDGESCWNSSITELPIERRNDGMCARNYICRLRDDLDLEDRPEATCACIEEGAVCSSLNRTYPTACALDEEAKRYPNLKIHLQHLDACPSIPVIYSAPEDVNAVTGQLMVLGCEAKGYPLPDVFWEFHSADRERVLKLPYDELDDGVVNNSESPGMFVRTSWLQVEHLKLQHAGTYYCIANNSIGQASAFSVVSIL